MVPAHLMVPALMFISMSRFVQMIGSPDGYVPSLFGFVSAAQPDPQFGTENSSTLCACGLKSRFVPLMLICGERSVTLPLRPESLVVSCSRAQYVPDGMFPPEMGMSWSPPP